MPEMVAAPPEAVAEPSSSDVESFLIASQSAGVEEGLLSRCSWTVSVAAKPPAVAERVEPKGALDGVRVIVGVEAWAGLGDSAKAAATARSVRRRSGANRLYDAEYRGGGGSNTRSSLLSLRLYENAPAVLGINRVQVASSPDYGSMYGRS